MLSLTRRLRPAGALVAVAALVTAAGASAESHQRPLLRVGLAGEGVVASADGRIRCGARCTGGFRAGARVTLRATPGRFFSFLRWTGGCVGRAPTCIVVVDRPTTIRALFVREQAFLSLAVSKPGTVVSDPDGVACGSASTDCSGDFPQGVPITLTPNPAEGGSFGVWGGACRQAGSGPCRLTLEGDAEVAAAFRPEVRSIGVQSLFVTVEGGASVVSEPSGINCPPDCDAKFPTGAVVTLRASRLGSWGVACVGAASECVLVLDDSTGVSARGSSPPPPPAPRFGLNVSVSGRGVVFGSPGIQCGGATGRLLDCERLYSRGTVVVLRAAPAKKFAGWGGGFCRGKKPRCTVRMTAAKIALAAFRR